MESLFGRICSGDIFIHDQEMRNLAKEKKSLRSRKRQRSSTTVQDSLSLNRRMIADSVSGNEISLAMKGDNEVSILHLNSGLKAVENRKDPEICGGLNFTAAKLQMAANSQPHVSDGKLHEVRRSFLDRVAEASSYTEPNQFVTAPTSPLNRSVDHHNLHQIMDWTQTCCGEQSGISTRESPEFSCQKKSIDLASSDDNFLLQSMPKSGGLGMYSNESQQSAQSCTTLSDSAFNSQTLRCDPLDRRVKSLQRRREAYKHAKTLGKSESWEPGLVSSGDQMTELEL